MCKGGYAVLVAFALAACGGNPGDEETATDQASPPAQSTELRDAARAPIERAEGVQHTLDERAAKLDAQTRAAVDPDASPNEDPSARKDKKDEDEE
jgi:hypothetical protein